MAQRWMLGIIVFVLAVVSGCTSPEEPDVPELQFDVDVDRLGERVVLAESGTAFQPPRTWEPYATAALDSLGRMMAVSGVAAELQPLYVFVDPEGGSVLSVATLRADTTGTLDERMAWYRGTLSTAFGGDSLREATFRKDGIRITQFLVQPAGLVNFKLVLEGQAGALLQFDYVVPREQYANELKAIESSIGSIRYVH